MSRIDWNRPEIERVEEGYRRIRLLVSYDGSAFHGWQKQKNELSVQGKIEDALSDVTGEDVLLFGSGRTDAGVHALGQVAHFDTRSKIDGAKFSLILNTKLEKAIRILSSEEASDFFHARYSTMAREYWYLIKRMDLMLPFDSKRYSFVKDYSDIDLLNSYADCIFGTHDFTTFASARDECPSKFRDIYLSKWDMIKDQFGCDVLRYRVCGNAFLYHQVRSMVGTMLESSRIKLAKQEFRSILDSKDRSRAMKTAPPDGLYLARISYDEDEYAWFEEKYGR